MFAIGARSINLPAFSAFSLAFVVLVILAIANLGGPASWTSTGHQDRRLGGAGRRFAAGYLASAIVFNVTLGKEVLPLWPAKSRQV